MNQERPLRFGIIGIGSGGSSLLEGFKRNPRVQVTAVADVRKEAVDAFAQEFGCEAYYSAEDLCQSPKVDAVWVATPNHLHAEHAIMACEHQKHVTVSKPMAITLEQCEAMCEAAERNGVVLLCGHTQSMLPGVRKMAEVVQSGEFGRLGMIHSSNYTDWIYRPRMPYELDESQGGGVVFRQSPHQIDIVRLIAGGMVKSVRATSLHLDASRPAPGAFVAYLEFEGRIPCTIIYSGYGRFRTNELTWGEGPPFVGRVTTDITAEQEAAMKEARRYTGGQRPRAGGVPSTHSAFGLTIASCEKADIRQSPNGLWIYDDNGKREIPVPLEQARGEEEFEEMYRAAVLGQRVIHDGRWGLATHEVSLAIMQSAREGREIFMSRQVPVPI